MGNVRAGWKQEVAIPRSLAVSGRQTEGFWEAWLLARETAVAQPGSCPGPRPTYPALATLEARNLVGSGRPGGERQLTPLDLPSTWPWIPAGAM